jgi:hypothetical protein
MSAESVGRCSSQEHQRHRPSNVSSMTPSPMQLTPSQAAHAHFPRPQSSQCCWISLSDFIGRFLSLINSFRPSFFFEPRTASPFPPLRSASCSCDGPCETEDKTDTGSRQVRRRNGSSTTPPSRPLHVGTGKPSCRRNWRYSRRSRRTPIWWRFMRRSPLPEAPTPSPRLFASD